MNAHSTDCQYLFLHPDALRDPANFAGPIALARFLAFSGYLSLGLALLIHILPDEPQHPDRKKCRERHMVEADQQAHRQWLLSLHTPTALQDGDFFMSAYDLHLDRTGRELQRIAALLEETGHDHLAALVRRQPPQPLERDVYPPDSAWSALLRGPDTGRKYPMSQPDCITIHPDDFRPETRLHTLLGLAHVFVRGDLQVLAAEFIFAAYPEGYQSPELKSYLELLPQVSARNQVDLPSFVTSPPAGDPAALFIAAFDLYTDNTGTYLSHLADYLESHGLLALADFVRAEPPRDDTSQHHLTLVQTA